MAVGAAGEDELSLLPVVKLSENTTVACAAGVSSASARPTTTMADGRVFMVVREFGNLERMAIAIAFYVAD